jgi:hypothetical protein
MRLDLTYLSILTEHPASWKMSACAEFDDIVKIDRICVKRVA